VNPHPEVAGGFDWHATPVGLVLRAAPLDPFAQHAFTMRGCRFRDDTTTADYGRLGQLFDVSPDRIARVTQVHGRTVKVVQHGSSLPDVGDADALVSFGADCALSVRVADCVPILLADRGRRVVAAVHAGWRGTCAGIVSDTVALIRDAGVPPKDLVAAIGPAIGQCCYQVDDRVRTTFLGMTPDAAAWFDEDGPGHWRLDLWRANADQLEDAGLPPNAIHVAGVCTAEGVETCYSYRREGPRAGRMVAAIRLRA